MKHVVLLPLLALLCSCANYQMGNTPKGAGFQDIRVLYLPSVVNETDETAVPGGTALSVMPAKTSPMQFWKSPSKRSYAPPSSSPWSST
jgi:hypothetical protein